MAPTTIVFLGIGAFSLLVLALSFVGSHLHFDFEGIGHSITLPAIAGFFGAFGFTGAIAIELFPVPGLEGWIGTGAGLLAAFPMGHLAHTLTRAAQNMATDATITSESLIGATGEIATAVRANGYGEVTLTVAGAPMRLNARSHEPIAAGTTVLVIGNTSPTCVLVEPAPLYFTKEDA